MKKASVFILCLSLITGIITGCTKNEFIEITRFTDNMNSQKTGQKIELSSYIIQNNIYSLPFNENGESVLLRLVTDENGYIEEIRLTLSKVDENGGSSPVNEKRKALFLSTLKRASLAYTYFDETENESIINSMKLDNTSTYAPSGELTLEKGNFYFVYFSTDLACQFTIYNIHLHPIEKTEKPESKPAFGNTTNIRTETVPLE